MQAALSAFAEWPAAGRKYLALGPMLELGPRRAEAHEALGRCVAAGPWEGIVVVAQSGGEPDEAAQALWDGLQGAGWPVDRRHAAADAADAAAWLGARLQPGDAVLLKASRGVHIEDVLSALKKEC
jgi:UDP-N-acetylmuramoyl-tripeptide--D-alanyl-D-alanine ligase